MGLKIPGVTHRPDDEPAEQKRQSGGRTTSSGPGDGFGGKGRFAFEINVAIDASVGLEPRRRRPTRDRLMQTIGVIAFAGAGSATACRLKTQVACEPLRSVHCAATLSTTMTSPSRR